MLQTTSLKTTVTYLLCLSLGTPFCGYQAYAGQQSQPTQQGTNFSIKADPNELTELHSLAAETSMDPLIQKLGSDKTTDLSININKDEPLLDKDPFFLRQQSWTKSHKVSDETEVRKVQAGLEILAANSQNTLRLNLPFEPVLETSEYIFLSARKAANVFDINGKSYGEGIFIIETADLEASKAKLDTVRQLIRDGKITFTEAVKKYGDKNQQSYNNDGRVANPRTGNSYFEVADLETSVFFAIDGLKEGDVAEPFRFKSPDGSDQFRIVQLVSRSKPHKADLKLDYGKIQVAALEQKKGDYTEKWVLEKLNTTYLSISDMFSACPNLQEMIGISAARRQ